jgi:hypothetical protein
MPQPVTEATISTLENTVYALLADKRAGTSSPIVTSKYLTKDNRLVYITQCTVAESAVPAMRIQIFERVEGGVVEMSYALFADHRFECTRNPMIFGDKAAVAENAAPTVVEEPTAQWLLELVHSLPTQTPLT